MHSYIEDKHTHLNVYIHTCVMFLLALQSSFDCLRNHTYVCMCVYIYIYIYTDTHTRIILLLAFCRDHLTTFETLHRD